jgi:peptidoglycan/xylan/chitin deacetylase (PgdA/CDA1 family)
MKKMVILVFVLVFVLVGCSQGKAQEATAVTSLPTKVLTVAPTVTAEPTTTPVPIFDTERQQIRAVMETYGRVDEKQLTDTYWERMADQIAKYGEAKRILTLEYHGDDYYMYNGAYSMTPEQFEVQMRFLLDNDYHFVTGPELVGYLNGWLKLPARSIILTTDAGGGTFMPVLPRISTLFKSLEDEYGVAPHMLSFIWTASMNPEKEGECKDDACYEVYRTALNTGYFTFGTHTETHRDFANLKEDDATWDLQTSMDKIQEELGIRVYSLSWPYESCSADTGMLTSLGIKYAFGGSSRSSSQLYTYANDNLPQCLPRLFPPNPNGYSGRPNNQTLEQMLNKAMEEYSPL